MILEKPSLQGLSMRLSPPAVQRIADKYNSKMIFDAAHAFTVEGAREASQGHLDLSFLSFHATKVFNTFKGGTIVCPDVKTKRRIDHLKNFGFCPMK